MIAALKPSWEGLLYPGAAFAVVDALALEVALVPVLVPVLDGCPEGLGDADDVPDDPGTLDTR